MKAFRSFATVLVLLLAAAPAHADDVSFSASVSSANAPVMSGYVEFVGVCGENAIASAAVTAGEVSAPVPRGIYAVRIVPSTAKSALTSWHSAKESCEEANRVVVDGDTTVTLVARAAPVKVTVTGVVDSGHGNLQSGSVGFYSDCAQSEPVASASIRQGAFTASLTAGQYRVRIGGETVSWHDAKPTCETAAVLTITDNSYVTLKAVPLFTLTGTVVSKHGPVDWGSVILHADCQAPEVARVEIGRGVFEAKLMPGTYRAHVVPRMTPSVLDSWHNARADCLSADIVTVAGDQSVELVVLATQTVGLRQHKRIRAGIKRGLPATTKQGVSVRWTARPKKVCTVRGRTLRTYKRGVCQLRAIAPAAPGLTAYSGTFVIKVFERRRVT